MKTKHCLYRVPFFKEDIYNLVYEECDDVLINKLNESVKMFVHIFLIHSMMFYATNASQYLLNLFETDLRFYYLCDMERILQVFPILSSD